VIAVTLRGLFNGLSHGFPVVRLELEARPTEPVAFKAQPHLVAEIDAYATRHGANRSQIVRALLRAGLASLSEQR
jgi:hypothetical protein